MKYPPGMPSEGIAACGASSKVFQKGQAWEAGTPLAASFGMPGLGASAVQVVGRSAMLLAGAAGRRHFASGGLTGLRALH